MGGVHLWLCWCFLLSVICRNDSMPTSQGLENDLANSIDDEIEEIERDGSDEGMYTSGFFQGDIYRRKARMEGIQTQQPVNIWPNGVIIYKVDEKIGCPESAQCAILMRAINHYHSHSCIRFQEWTGEENYVRIFYNPNSGACWSAVGKTGGEQLLSLGRRCWYQGIVIHELGHSVGLWHEMNRPDRDEHITINWENILPGYAPAFDKQSVSEYRILDETFDFGSIMMYDEYAFAKDKHSPTIEAKDHSVIGPIWRKPGLSINDVERIRRMYECDSDTKFKSTSEFPYDITCSFDNHACGFKSSGKNPWKWHKINETDGYVYNVNKGSAGGQNGESVQKEDLTGHFVSVNFHGISAEKAKKSQEGCVRFWYLIRGMTDAYLKVRQSYLVQTTQLTVIEQDTFDLWESDGPNYGEWSFVKIPLFVTKPFKLIFESSPGVDSKGLVALDNLEIKFSPCQEEST